MNALTIEAHAQGIGLNQPIPVPLGLNIAEIAARISDRVESLTAWIKAPTGHAVEWIEVPRERWLHIKPKLGGILRFGYRLGKKALKKVFSIVAAVIVAVVAPVLAGTAAFSTLFGTNALLAATLATGTAVSLLGQTLFPSQSSAATSSIGTGVQDAKNESRAFTNVETDNNLLAKEAYLPTVVGQRRISLPEIAQPRAFLDPESGLQTVHRIFALKGEHQITDVQVAGVPVAEDDSYRVQIIEGAEADPTETFVNKISYTEDISAELVNFSLDGTVLVDQDTPANSEPRWERFKTRYDTRLEAINIRLALDNMLKSVSAGTKVRVPVRIRFRKLGSLGAWTNLPEIHFIGNLASTSLQEITIRWDTNFGVADTVGDITHQFFQRVPAATAGPLSSGTTVDQWQAEAQFVSGSGLRDVANISGGRNGVRIKLDPTVTPADEFEFEIKRGFAFDDGSLTTSAYGLAGAVHSLFEAYSVSSNWSVATDQGDFLPRAQLVFSSSVVDRQPCQKPGTALLALESKGKSVRAVTALCGAKVPVWDGETWSGSDLTKNPAAHYRESLHRYLGVRGQSTEIIDQDSIVALYENCVTQGLEVSVMLAEPSYSDAIRSILEAGYATPALMPELGVDWYRDRSGERPVQLFSPRNSTISIEYKSEARPSGIRAKFQNERKNYVDDEVTFGNPFYTSFSGYEVLEYPSISNPDLVERRAYFDLLQLEFQSYRTWVIETATEGLVCKKGDLISVATDLLSDHGFGARVTEVLRPNAFRIDQLVPVQATESLYDIKDIFAVDDLFSVGGQSAIFISGPNGTHQSTITGADGDVIRIKDNMPGVVEGETSQDFDGSHLIIGPIENFIHRCVVSQITALSEERSRLVLVDEAPEIHEHMQARFG